MFVFRKLNLQHADKQNDFRKLNLQHAEKQNDFRKLNLQHADKRKVVLKIFVSLQVREIYRKIILHCEHVISEKKFSILVHDIAERKSTYATLASPERTLPSEGTHAN
jgi:hypothetical protein